MRDQVMTSYYSNLSKGLHNHHENHRRYIINFIQVDTCIVFLCSIKGMWRVRYQCKKLSVECYLFFFYTNPSLLWCKMFHLVFINYYAPKTWREKKNSLPFVKSYKKKMNKTLQHTSICIVNNPPLSALKLPTT